MICFISLFLFCLSKKKKGERKLNSSHLLKAESNRIDVEHIRIKEQNFLYSVALYAVNAGRRRWYTIVRKLTSGDHRIRTHT